MPTTVQRAEGSSSGAHEQDIGVALVGTGGIANLYAQALEELEGVRLIGGWNRTRSKAAALMDSFGVKVYDTLPALIADPVVDAVAVLTAAGHHVDPAIACLEGGKHVFVEKPVATSVAEIRSLQKAATAAGRLCVPAHNYIQAPALRRAKQQLDAGRYGKVSSLWVIYNIQQPDFGRLYGDVVREICIHHAYSVLRFLGRPRRVTAVGSNTLFDTHDAWDQAMIVCEMPGGAIANLWCSVVADDPTSDPWTVVYKILGTKGGFNYTWNESHYAHENPVFGIAPYADSFYYELDYFLNGCIRAGKSPLSTLDDAADALCLIEAAEASLEGGKAVSVAYV